MVFIYGMFPWVLLALLPHGQVSQLFIPVDTTEFEGLRFLQEITKTIIYNSTT